MASRMRRPETTLLHISQGDWLLVKKHLTAGEQRAVYDRMMRAGATSAQIDPLRVGLSMIAGYLLDWSITDPDDKKVVILDQPADVVLAALDALDVESFKEIRLAIEDHAAAMEADREAEKNVPATVSAS